MPSLAFYIYLKECILCGVAFMYAMRVGALENERTIMAQDYDSPRSKDEDEESLQALIKGSQNSSSEIDDDENAIAEDYELPGADLSGEDASVTVIPMQGDEFICSECFLVKHRSQLAESSTESQPVCKECAA
ncbi:hypothetical protein HMPREF3230_00492 [Gardnerella vaginalis]|uniref:dUTPase n=2 Tax=Bifidobacteriaceae TaxID=31953 RepID=A0A135Z8Q1_GARVA|nr:hypothetical protein HMPREF3230_00492 [Gardnerella vaginalis]